MVESAQNCDVVVIGGGNAALCAAITAREAGASVLVVEHAPKAMRGGNSRHTRNLRLMHEAPTKVLSDAYTENDYWDDLLRVTKGETDEYLAKMTIRRSAELSAWMESHGVRFQPSLTGTLDLSRTNAFFLGGGKALLNSYYNTADKLGIKVHYEVEVLDVRREGNVIRDITIVQNGEKAIIVAKSVVVASGGFQANIEWLREIWGGAADNFIIRGTPYAQGKVLKALLNQGIAQVGDPSQFHAVAIDARAPKFDGGIVTRLDCVPFSIVVNRDGKRFYDEGQDMWPKRYAIWGRLVAQCPEQVAYCVFDRKCINLFMPSVFPVFKADSLGELAAQLTLDPGRLAATVAEYNRAVVPGEFNHRILDNCTTQGLNPPKSHWAQPIDSPPFYAYPLRPGITFTYLGIKVDEHARAMTTEGHTMANLFAAGEIMSGNVLGQGYLAGFGMTLGSVFGRIAGAGAAKYAIN